MNSNRTFGDWLRRHRRALDLTQEQLARQVGCSAILLRKLESEERRPSQQIVERLADIFGLPPDERPTFLRFARGDPFAAPAGDQAADKLELQPAPRHNLPLQLTSFIGREKEIAEIRAILTPSPAPARHPSPSPEDSLASGEGEGPGVGVRLLTLTGVGGSGKTRLARQVAADLLSAFADGVWWIDLAPLGDPTLVPQTVASVLRVPEQASRPLLATLTDHLRGQTALLVLDNCEHLISACAQLTEAILQACPNLSLLATSREALQLAGESVFVVPPLASPDPRQLPPLDTIREYEAVRLFVDRAQAVLPGFNLNQANAPAVVLVCRQLDGIPLAIELAAARVRLLKVEQIAQRLDDRFQLLRGGTRTALPRHQTLGALIDWSYDLLSEPERVLLWRLAVFAGGWTLEAAEAVCDGERTGERAQGSPDTLDLLTQLVNKSLVVAVRQPGEEARYQMLETIRQYALARLDASGVADAVQRRHADYYRKLTEPLMFLFSWRGEAIDRMMDREHANLLAALAWSQSSIASEELQLGLLASAAGLFVRHGYVSEVHQSMEAAVARPGVENYPRPLAPLLGTLGVARTMRGEYRLAQDHFTRALSLAQEQGDKSFNARMLERLGWLAREQGDVVTARLRLEEALVLFRELGDSYSIAGTSNTLGEVLVMEEDSSEAAALLRASLTLARQLGDVETTAFALNHLGHVAQLDGDFNQAQRLHEESLPMFHQIAPGFQGTAEANESLGETALAQGDPARAAKHFAQSLEIADDLGLQACQSWCVAGLAGVALLGQEPERAVQLWGAAEALRLSLGCRPAPAARATRERLMAEARTQLGDEAFAAAWAAGAKMTLAQAVAYALKGLEREGRDG